MELIFALFLALGLAIAAGMRAFLPLFLLGLSIRVQLPVPYLDGHEGWLLSTDFALLILGILALAEIGCDMVPLLDNSLQGLYFVVRPLAGGLAALSVLDGSETGILAFWVALMIAVFLAICVSLPVHTVSTGVRATSTVTTAGTANPLISIKETILAFLATVFSIVMAPLAILLMGLTGWAIYRFVKRKWAEKQTLSSPQEVVEVAPETALEVTPDVGPTPERW